MTNISQSDLQCRNVQVNYYVRRRETNGSLTNLQLQIHWFADFPAMEPKSRDPPEGKCIRFRGFGTMGSICRYAWTRL